MSVKDAIFIVGTLLAMPLFGLVAWVISKIIDRVSDHRDEVEELREKLEIAEDERDRWKEKPKTPTNFCAPQLNAPTVSLLWVTGLPKTLPR